MPHARGVHLLAFASAAAHVLLPMQGATRVMHRCHIRSCEGKRDGKDAFDPSSRMISTMFPEGKGRRIAWGLLTTEVDSSSVPSDMERQQLREAAASQLVNIDQAERDRRKMAGSILSVATVCIAVALLAAHADAAARAAILPFVFLSNGYLASAREGL
ncbi:hypothetical protein AB1Y20_015248 [Prymnesium parvum]|uniref:Uncharacterized protein n=1 Tax=Prymnesium parvum TaxID=97485 RepID=A0AB34K216_PRYPA